MPVGPGGPGGPGARFRLGSKPRDTRGTLLRLWSYLATQRRSLVLTTALVVVSSGLSLLGPLLMGRAIDLLVATGDLAGVTRILVLMLVLYAVSSLARWAQDYVVAGVAQRTVRNMRDEYFAKLHTLSLRFFDQQTHGDLMSRLTNDIENINTVLSTSASQLISNALSFVGLLVVMFALNIPLAFVSMLVIPLTMLIARAVADRSRQAFRDQQRELGTLNGIIEETITGQKVVQAYVREEQAIAEFDVANRALQRAATHAQALSGVMGPLGGLVNNSAMAAVAGAGGVLVLQGMATVGMVASFALYARQFARPINQIATLYNTIQSALAGAERVFAVLDQVPELADEPDACEMPGINGDVVFDDVSFSYVADVPVLKRVNMHAEAGDTVALVGPTGAGKTTIINLLTRFYDIDSGAIRIDGRDIRATPKADLRGNLGLVLQDNYLFGDTVMENIRYGRLDATDEEVIAASMLANAHGFIRRLPTGYETVLVERGANLSHGQRQLVAIARAVLADPDVLILDEATSNVDTRTEQHLQEALLKLMEGRTSFVIAHRLSTIRDADQVLVIRDGEVIERGTHETLLADQGFYHNLYLSQFKGQAMPA